MHDKYVIEHYNNLVVEQSRFYQHRGQTFAHVRIYLSHYLKQIVNNSYNIDVLEQQKAHQQNFY